MKEIIINNFENDYEILLVEDGDLKEIYNDVDSKKRIEGNIYIGKVMNIVPGLQAAFIDIGENKNVFIRATDFVSNVDFSNSESNTCDSVSLNINDFVKPGMPILIQIKKDSYESKGAKVSVNINLPGRFIALLPNSSFITISHKIEDEKEKARLLKIVKDYLPENMGAIIRTAAVSKSEDEIKFDVDNLIEKWNEIISTEVNSDCIPKLVYKSGGLLEKTLVDLVDNSLDRIIVNDKSMEKRVKDILKSLKKDNFNVMYKNEDLADMYRIRQNKEIVQKRKVWLKCGGFIVIDKTEALTAIDVNSGKYVGKDELEKTALYVNKESAIEIAKQIRLRDIGGIIIIDFIDMKLDESRKEILDVFSNELKKDRSKVQVEGFTKLNLLEMTRKHICSK